LIAADICYPLSVIRVLAKFRISASLISTLDRWMQHWVWIKEMVEMLTDRNHGTGEKD